MPPAPSRRPPGTAADLGAGAGVGRRGLLRSAGLGAVAVAAAASLAGCGVRWEDVRLDDVPTPEPPALGPDDLARFAAIASVQALLDLATTVSDPLAVAVADRHRVHLERLGPLPGPIPSPSATPSGWPTTSPPPTGAADLTTLAAAEAAAGTALVAAASAPGSQVGGPLALVLVAIGTRCRVTAASLGTEVAGTVLPEEVDPAGLRAAGEPLAALVEAHRAAAYGYGVLAVRLADGARDTARDAIAAHRATAQHLLDLAAPAGIEVPPAGPAYVVAAPADAAAAGLLALSLELDVAAAAGALVAAATGAWRTLAADHLGTVALGARAWGEVPAFPGAPALE